MLEIPSVKKWLGGIEPAWTSLDQESFHALRRPPSPTKGAIWLANDLTPEEIQRSPVASNALILLHAAAEGPGLKLTATGNLSRSVVAQMCDLFTWPDFDRANAFWLNKVINEPDFLPLYFVRHVVESSTLLRRYKGHLRISPAGRKILDEPNQRSLQAVLFHICMWHLDLGYLGRGLHQGWPQGDVGIVLWSLSVAAKDWETPERLTRLCTIPTNGMLEAQWDTGAMAMEARVLRPLLWFGLFEHREEEIEGSRFGQRHFYRKTALFDRMIAFDVRLERAAKAWH